MGQLTSIDYARLIAWIAYYKLHIILNKTQMQKLLFMCYGQYLAVNKTPLFIDDTPKAWPFGPVFPRTYKRYEEVVPTDLTDSQKIRYAQDREALSMIATTVATYARYSATRLSDWSHQKDSPWFKTVFESNKAIWNKDIPNQLIIDYFADDTWKSKV